MEFVEVPPPAMPAALATGRVDAATLIHAQAYLAGKTGDFHSVVETGKDLLKLYGVQMVSAVLAGYGDKLDANPAMYGEALRLLKASKDYALANRVEVFGAVGKETNIDPDFFETWFTRFSEFPVSVSANDEKAIDILFQQAVKLKILDKAPAGGQHALDGCLARGAEALGMPRGTAWRATLLAHMATLAALAAWWVYSLFEPPYLVPGPLPVFSRMVDYLADPDLRLQLVASLVHVLAAIVIAFACGAALATAAQLVPAVRLLVDGRITPFLNAFSGIGWLFLGVIWFGLTDTTVVFTVAIILVPFAIINFRTAVGELDAELTELGRSLSHSRLRVFRTVMVPQLVPYVFTTLRTCFGVAWKVVLTAELFGGNSGIGAELNVARQQLDTETILALILFILCFVVLAEVAVFRPGQRMLDRRYRDA